MNKTKNSVKARNTNTKIGTKTLAVQPGGKNQKIPKTKGGHKMQQ